MRGTRAGSWLCIGLAVAFFAGGCPSSGPPRFRHAALEQWLRECAPAFTFEGGAWLEDFGDGPFWGLAFYARAGAGEGNAAYLDRARESYAWNWQLLREGDLITDDANDLVMSALGIIEYMVATGDREALPDLDAFVDDLNTLVENLGGYLEPPAITGYAMETYGPVSINGLVALLYAQHALLLADPNRDRYLASARQMADRIRERSWNGSAHDFSPTREGLFLYPNVTMILLYGRLYQLTGEPLFLDRALQTYAGIQPLKVTEESGWVAPGRYRSPYSAETMGAQTEDYTTLSSQNYLMFSLLLMYQITRDSRYLEEVDVVLDFIDGTLRGEWCLSGFYRDPCDPVCQEEQVCVTEACRADTCACGVLHHWMDGRLALPSDPEFFCAACNLQLLYVLWYRQQPL